MADFHFLRPFWLLAILPVLLIWWRLYLHRNRAARWRKNIDPHLLKHLMVGEELQSWFCPLNILLLMLVVAAIGMAGPSWKQEPSPFLDDEAGIMIVLKLSSTMNGKDVQPSRLERSKQKIHDLLQLRQGAAAGLIVYSGSSHLVMPMTQDERVIDTMLADMSPDLMPVDGDNLLQALSLSDEMMEKSGRPGSVLVIADSVSLSQTGALQKLNFKWPLQFLSMLPPSAAVDSGLQQSADLLGADLVKMSIDPSDVERVAKNGKRKFTAASLDGQGTKWQDSGYLLLPLIAVFTLLWFRKGWVLQ